MLILFINRKKIKLINLLMTLAYLKFFIKAVVYILFILTISKNL